MLRLIPLSLFGKIQIDETPLTDEEEKKSLVTVLRKSHRQSLRNEAQRTQEFNNRESQRQLSLRKSRQVSGAMRASGAPYIAHGSNPRGSVN